MRFAYADPPYFGCAAYYDHPQTLEWNDLNTHKRLIDQLEADFPAGWAMSLSSPNLHVILPMCPRDCRIAAWIKPWCSFKPSVRIAYSWEPVIFKGGRKRTREQDTVRDWISANSSMEKGLMGAKPRAFCLWLYELLNLMPGDELVDLFPGTGIVGGIWKEICETTPQQLKLVPING